MIYTYPDKEDEIKQGDIFYPLPLLILNLENLQLLSGTAIQIVDWESVKGKENIAVNVPVINTWGIVSSQDCDASRVPNISFFKIDSFFEVTKITPPSVSAPKWWIGQLTKKKQDHSKWFYLPEESTLGFSEKMAVHFQVVFQIDREYLEKHKELRKGRLKNVAYEHYRESIAQYYRRYPYDEWYPFNKTEFEEYQKEQGGSLPTPYDWQK